MSELVSYRKQAYIIFSVTLLTVNVEYMLFDSSEYSDCWRLSWRLIYVSSVEDTLAHKASDGEFPFRLQVMGYFELYGTW